jgi:hypothetical protein
MNFFQAFNLSVFVGTLGALVAGLSKVPFAVGDWPLTLWLLLAMFFFLRLKIVMDDHKYFSQPKTKNANFKIGFIAAVASWLFWGLGGYSMANLQQAYFMIGVATSISTLWILAVACFEGASKEQYVWIGTNTMTILLLWGAYRRNAAGPDWVTWMLLGVILLLVLADFVYSKSVPELEQ